MGQLVGNWRQHRRKLEIDVLPPQTQQTYQRLQQDLAKKEQDATRGIFTKLQGVVATIADRDHFSVVLEKNAAVVYGQPSLEITNEVIRMYNAGSGSDATPKKK